MYMHATITVEGIMNLREWGGNFGVVRGGAQGLEYSTDVKYEK